MGFICLLLCKSSDGSVFIVIVSLSNIILNTPSLYSSLAVEDLRLVPLSSPLSFVANSIGTASNTPVRVQYRLREAMHEIAYAYCHAMWRNATYNAESDPSDAIVSIPPKDSYLWWQPAIISLDAFVYGGLLIGLTAAGFAIFNSINGSGKGKNENE